jgi:hypothetical protein
MAHGLLFRRGMKTLTLLLVLLVTSAAPSYAQDANVPDGAIVESADVSGIPINQLSPGLRQAIEGLVEKPLSQTQLSELADRIEEERPELVAAVRTVPRPNGKAQVIFLVARISDNPDLSRNINVRYPVAVVGIDGIADDRLSQTLRDDLQKLVGRPLDDEEADKLAERIRAEVPGHSVGRRISRATEVGKIRVMFEVRRIEPPAWIPYSPSRNKVLFQEGHGWTGALEVSVGQLRNHKFTVGGVFHDKDTLLEISRGYQLRFESAKIGTRKLGASLEYSSLDQTWDDRTVAAVAADPTVPPLYRGRNSIEPMITFAPDSRVRVSAGMSSTELEPFDDTVSAASRMANVVTFAASGERAWRPAIGGRHRIEGSYGLRSTAFDSDFDYTRHYGQARYEFSHRDSRIIARFSAGHITGTAPMFERFALGDTTTLRGWNKVELSPAGGRNMFHQSVEYRFHGLAMFLDTGSVWEPITHKKVRVSTGVGFHHRNGFITFGIPLNADNVSSTFMAGIRF